MCHAHSRPDIGYPIPLKEDVAKVVKEPGLCTGYAYSKDTCFDTTEKVHVEGPKPCKVASEGRPITLGDGRADHLGAPKVSYDVYHEGRPTAEVE